MLPSENSVSRMSVNRPVFFGETMLVKNAMASETFPVGWREGVRVSGK